MEIERKFLVKHVPAALEQYSYHIIEQAYLCTSPVIRIRRQDNDYILTYKSKGMMVREEYNLPLTKDSYEHLLEKADGNVISKTRYLIPLADGLTAELDIFNSPFDAIQMAEVEFVDEASANRFLPPDWFAEEVTYNPAYHNSFMSSLPLEQIGIYSPTKK